MPKKATSSELKNFRFKKHVTIGAADAIEDKLFLEECFIDTGELAILRDNNQPECIIMGRTGLGKTALLERLHATEDRVIKIKPEGLALTYISNNEVLRFFIEVGVKMDLFYRLLWRHIFAIEIIKARYQIVNEQTRDNFIEQIKQRIFPNKAKQEAVEYLVDWGESFWKETDYRVKEITTTLVENLQKSVSGKVDAVLPGANGSIQFGADKAKSLTKEQKDEIVQHGQPIVDQIQIKKLSDIINLLDSDILSDKQKKYFITIDRLDENWVDDGLRYHLIRALLETARDFNKIATVKIVVAVREDLIDRVFRFTRDPGYQEEKYTSMYLNLSWTESELEELLNSRVNSLIKRQYTTLEIDLREILPQKLTIDSIKVDPVTYILDRTMLRPRDAISFFNECINAAQGNPTISQTNILAAETKYSEKRFRALADEWAADYPNLIDMSLFLRKYPKLFKYEDINKEDFVTFLVAFLDDFRTKQDSIYKLIEENFDSTKVGYLLQELLRILYRVGMVGIQPDGYQEISWSYQGYKTPEIISESTIHIHPAFWKVLGIQT